MQKRKKNSKITYRAALQSKPQNELAENTISGTSVWNNWVSCPVCAQLQQTF